MNLTVNWRQKKFWKTNSQEFPKFDENINFQIPEVQWTKIETN